MITLQQALDALREVLDEVHWVDFHNGDSEEPLSDFAKRMPGGYAGPVSRLLAHYLNEAEMTRQRRKSEMPSDEEVLDTKIWTLAHHLDDEEVKPHVFVKIGDVRLQVDEVVLSMSTTPYQVEVRTSLIEDNNPEAINEFLRRVKAGELNAEQDTTMEEELGEGDVRSGRSDGQPGPESPTA